VRRAVRARAAQAGRALAHLRVQRIDLERVLANQPRLQREHLLFHPDAWRSIRLGNTVVTGVRRDLDQRVGAAGPLEHHHVKIADLRTFPLGSRVVVSQGQSRRHEWRGSDAAQKLPA